MPVREVMTAPVVTVQRDWTVRQAAGLLFERDITAAPVLDERGSMVGIVSEMFLLTGQFEADPRVCLRLAAEPDSPPPQVVGQVMTRSVRTVRETEDVLTLVDLMVTARVKSVPSFRAPNRSASSAAGTCWAFWHAGMNGFVTTYWRRCVRRRSRRSP